MMRKKKLSFNPSMKTINALLMLMVFLLLIICALAVVGGTH